MTDSRPSDEEETSTRDSQEVQEDPVTKRISVEDSDRKELQEIRDVVTRYIGQLLYGCNDSTCTERFCSTGIYNTSQRPVRKHTPRSARAIAIMLVSRPRPRAHLCTRYVPDPESNSISIVEGPQDSGSFMQRFVDVPSIRRLDLSAASPRTVAHDSASSQKARENEAFETALRYYTTCLKHEATCPNGRLSASLEQILEQNEELSGHLRFYFQWILDSLPKGGSQQWRYVNHIISANCAYPSHNLDKPCDLSFNTWLRILDALEHRPMLEFLGQLLAVLTKHWNIELNASNSEPCDAYHSGAECRRLLCHLAHNIVGSTKHPGEMVKLVVILKKVFLHSWDGQVQTQRTVAYAALAFMARIRSQYVRRDIDLGEEIFEIPAITHRLDLVDVARTWLNGHRTGHLLDFGFLFTLKEQATYFRTMNHLRMQKTNSDAVMAQSLREKLPSAKFTPKLYEQIQYLEERYLLLSVSRSNLLEDTFDQLWQRRPKELLRPLRVRLGEMDRFEIGHDLGGVQVEFFNLVCRELMDESKHMFTTDSRTGYSYFRAASLQPLYMFELCGLLFAIAIYNGITLPVNFPTAFYSHLCGKQKPNVELLSDAWPDIEKSLRSICHDDAAGFDNTFSLEANGLRLTVLPDRDGQWHDSSRIILPVVDATPIIYHPDARYGPAPNVSADASSSRPSAIVDIDNIADAWPGWHLIRASAEPQELTDETKHIWARDYAFWLTFSSVAPQFMAFQRGFKHIFENFDMLSLRHVKTIFEGTTHLDINELRRITEYDGFDPTSRYIQGFWALVESWPEEKQKQLLKFVTACERLPAGGAGSITFKIQRAMHVSSDYLPTSSTCFGALTLPKYENMKVLDKKLSLALKYGAEGFGAG